MEPVNVQLAPLMPDGLYDMHGGYNYTPSLWGHREDRTFSALQPDPPSSRSENSTRSDIKKQSSENNGSSSENTETKKDQNENTKSDSTQKQSQVACTLKWLSENYERAEGVCLPRCVLYTHYLDFCKKMKYTPAGAATFGKIIRQKFSKITTRRLGTRGQSKYHYYGIGIKETSIYYHSVYSGKGLTRFSGIKIKTEGSNRKFSLSSKTGTLLPEFPNAENLILPENVDRDKMQTFIMMYRTHCQRILDTVISANFEEVQNFLLHFWQGMPEHLISLLSLDMVADIVGLCDSILYKVVIDVLIPSTIQDLPDSLGSEIKIFIRRLTHWLTSSLEDVPNKLRDKKIKVAKHFTHSIKRQMSFVHLAQTARSVLHNQESLNGMIEDVSNIDLTEICCQAGFTTPKATNSLTEIINDCFDEFQNLLTKQAPIEGYTEWLDNIIDKCVLQPLKDHDRSFQETASKFILHWEIIGSLFMRDLTLHNASSFGAFHLIHMMFDEYVFLVMETQHDQVTDKTLQKAVQKYMKCAEEIKTQAKVRVPSSKHIVSPKGRKRKIEEEVFDSNDEGDNTGGMDENRPGAADSYSAMNGTAFSRPAPSIHRDPCNLAFPEENCRSGISHSTLPLSPLKHYSTINGSAYDRPTYISQYGLNSYGDIMNTNNSFTTPRVQPYGESHINSFTAVPFTGSVPQATTSYWADSRTHPTFHETYNPYGYNKFHSSYDTYNKSSFLRGTTYQDSINRSAFENSRNYYRSSHDNFQVGSHISIGSLNGTYMDIAQPQSQYPPRQDSAMFFQDDLYANSMPPSFSTIGKPYFAAAFR